MQKKPLHDSLLRFVSKLEEQTIYQNLIMQLRPDLQCSLLLFCCWYAASGYGRLSKQEMQQLCDTVSEWHERVTKAMTVLARKAEKTFFPSEIKRLAAAQEQLAENNELLMLSDVLIKFSKPAHNNPQQQLTDACKNIVLYCRLQQIHVADRLVDLFYQLIAMVFPAIDLLETHTRCQEIFLESKESRFKQERMQLEFG